MESTKSKQGHKFLKVVVVLALFLFVGAFSTGEARAASGELWVSGQNGYGELGLGYEPVYSNPPGWPSCCIVTSLTQAGTATNWASIDGAFSTSAGIKTDGTLWTWGLNTYCTGSGTYGQVICASDLGLYASQLCPWVNGTSFASLCLPPLDAATGGGVSSPTRVGSDSDWASVSHTASPIDTTFAIKTDGTLWCWGRNSSGTCGLGYTSFSVDFPTQVQPGTTWRIIRGGYYHVMGIKTDGTLWAWVGPDGYGALGLGTDYQSVAYYSTPHQVGSDSNWADVQAGYHSTVALKTNGTLWGWGANQWGQLGLGDTTHRYSPTRIGTDTNWASVSMRSNESVQAIKTDGTLWAWGQNVYGNLGLGTGGTYYGPSSPTRVGADSDWAKVSVGNFPYEYAMAIKTNGTLWGWGANSNGQLGLGDTTNRYSPTRVGTGTNWGSVSAGSYYTLAITGTPPPPSTLKACMDSCTTGASAITSLAMSQNDTRTIVACYNTATACNAPDNTGNVTLSSLWEESGTDVVSLSNQSNSTKKFQSGTAYGTETVTITHLTQSVALNVTVPCVETATCDSEQNKVCSDKTVPAGTTLSGICGTVDCGGKSGKRYCDFNWKEVAP